MTTERVADHRPSLTDARAAVQSFLREALPEVWRVDVTRIAPVESREAVWEADAVVWQPNATIQALQLSTEHPVLDQSCYQVRLDGQLNVTAYEIRETERAT
jgi:hypothetical protein